MRANEKSIARICCTLQLLTAHCCWCFSAGWTWRVLAVQNLVTQTTISRQ